jgi:hypothetical protein
MPTQDLSGNCKFSTIWQSLVTSYVISTRCCEPITAEVASSSLVSPPICPNDFAPFLEKSARHPSKHTLSKRRDPALRVLCSWSSENTEVPQDNLDKRVFFSPVSNTPESRFHPSRKEFLNLNPALKRFSRLQHYQPTDKGKGKTRTVREAIGHADAFCPRRTYHGKT